MEPFEVISAATTRSPKEGAGEDRVRCFRLDPEGDAPGGGVVICDGVGALGGSALAAEWAAQKAADHVVSSGVRWGVWSLAEIWDEEAPTAVEGATTLVLLAAEAGGVVAHTLIGNGSIFEVASSRLPDDGVRLLWTDVAIPQIDWSEGKPALSSTLPTTGQDLVVSRGAHMLNDARLYVLCSDGISTLEERPDATAPDDSIWREVPSGLTRLLRTLAEIWNDLLHLPCDVAQQALQEGVEEVLADLEGDSELEDDASLGVVLVRPVNAAEAVVGDREAENV